MTKSERERGKTENRINRINLSAKSLYERPLKYFRVYFWSLKFI